MVFPGRRWGGPGPDFRGAVLALPDGTLLRGDVEIHRRARDWTEHGHAQDPAYANVVLHVVQRLDAPVLDAIGQPIPTLEITPTPTEPSAWPHQPSARTSVPSPHSREPRQVREDQRETLIGGSSERLSPTLALPPSAPLAAVQLLSSPPLAAAHLLATPLLHPGHLRATASLEQPTRAYDSHRQGPEEDVLGPARYTRNQPRAARTSSPQPWAPSWPHPWSLEQPCLQNAAEILTVVQDAGRERLRAKAARFEADLTARAPDQVLWRGILEALGYTRNVHQFGDLAEAVPCLEAAAVVRERGPVALAGLLLGTAGLRREASLPEAHAWARLQRLRGLRPALSASAWDTRSLRAANAPARRCRGLAELAARWAAWRDAGPAARRWSGSELAEQVL